MLKSPVIIKTLLIFTLVSELEQETWFYSIFLFFSFSLFELRQRRQNMTSYVMAQLQSHQSHAHMM